VSGKEGNRGGRKGQKERGVVALRGGKRSGRGSFAVSPSYALGGENGKGKLNPLPPESPWGKNFARGCQTKMLNADGRFSCNVYA